MLDPYDVLTPHWNVHDVLCPFGLMTPVTVAEFRDTDEVGPVETPGGG